MSVVTAATTASRRTERDFWSMPDLLHWIHRKGIAGAALKSTAETDLVRMARSCRSRSRVSPSRSVPQRWAPDGATIAVKAGPTPIASVRSPSNSPVASERSQSIGLQSQTRLTCKGEGCCCGSVVAARPANRRCLNRRPAWVRRRRSRDSAAVPADQQPPLLSHPRSDVNQGPVGPWRRRRPRSAAGPGGQPEGEHVGADRAGRGGHLVVAGHREDVADPATLALSA